MKIVCWFMGHKFSEWSEPWEVKDKTLPYFQYAEELKQTKECQRCGILFHRYAGLKEVS